MKIDQVTLYHLSMELVAPFETSFGISTHRDCVLIEARGDGEVGYGECVADRNPGFNYETVGTAWHILKSFLIPAILGKDLVWLDGFHQQIASVRGHRMAKAGLEMALWDLMGKRRGHSLRRMIGGVRDRVPVGVSVGIQESPGALVKVVEDYLNEGYRRVKLKIKPGRDINEVTAVRDSFPNLRLQVDANAAYSLESANGLKPLDDMDLLLIEQPLAEDDLWDHSKLQAQFNTPLCLDESIRSVRLARQALEMRSCRVINIKAGRVGGIHEAVAIHNVCRERGIPVWCGGMLETGVGRASNLALASLPGFSLPGDISATRRYYKEDITEEIFDLNSDSTITVPAIPGLGVMVNPRQLEKVTNARLTIK